MNSFLFKTHDLLSGERSPITGNYVMAAQARSMSCMIYATGVTGVPLPIVTLSYPHPIVTNSGVSILSMSLATGTSTRHVQLTGCLPVPMVRASTYGATAYTYVTLYQQN